MIPVIISGGSGTRLWPLSRAQFPKQFCEIFGESLQETTLRRLGRFGTPAVVTSKDLRTLTETQLKKLGLSDVVALFEPAARNTAPAIAFFCRWAELHGKKDEIVGFFPSDHLIGKEDVFEKTVKSAEEWARRGHVVTLGVKPSRPETGFGYIQTADQTLGAGDFAPRAVRKFHEKPDLETAKKFLADGHFSWNAGIFVFKVSTMIALLKEHQPELWKGLEPLKTDLSNVGDLYPRLPSISIDYAVMEKIGGRGDVLLCIPADFGWNDVGSWDAVADEFLARHVNAGGEARVQQVECGGNFAFTLADKNVSFVGISDLRVVDTGDALLISKAGESQKVRDVVAALTKENSPLVKAHSFEQRPWGQFEVLRDTDHFKSKVIRVEAGQQISYQSHAKREEHWILTKGAGEMILDDKAFPVKAGQYIHIPLGAKHRIRNTSKEILEFVEVQLGTYFGEDDIVRYQDDYRRV